MQVGDRVSWWTRGLLRTGTITRVNPKTVTVQVDDGPTARLEPMRLTVIDAPPAVVENVIQFPHHAAGVGARVWFQLPNRTAMSGTVVAVDAYHTKIQPDDGSAIQYTVAHAFVSRQSDQLPKRPDDVVMHEIARCYTRIERNWNRNISPRMEKQVERRLRLLFQEFGRHVSRDEAIDFAIGKREIPPR